MPARKPRELSDIELMKIASKVRSRLEARYGIDRIRGYFNNVIAVDLVKETYIAVREQLEQENARS